MARRSVSCAVALFTVLGLSGVAGAGGPREVTAASSQTLPAGHVVQEFTQGGITVRTIGARALSSLQLIALDLGGPHGSLEIGSRPESTSETTGGAPVMTAVDSLTALGVDPVVAQRDFGDFDSPAGAAASSVRLASFQDPALTSPIAPAVTVSSTVPLETRCYSWNGVAGGHIWGQACSSVYVVGANGADWQLQNKYKATAWSDDTSLFPVRINGLRGSISVGSGNTVVDWDPNTTTTVNSCGLMTFGVSAVGNVSLTVQVCPTKIAPFNLTLTSSGANWTGVERDNDPVGVGGWQQVHKPSSATWSWSTSYLVSW